MGEYSRGEREKWEVVGFFSFESIIKIYSDDFRFREFELILAHSIVFICAVCVFLLRTFMKSNRESTGKMPSTMLSAIVRCLYLSSLHAMEKHSGQIVRHVHHFWNLSS